jgi:hypothetical protein
MKAVNIQSLSKLASSHALSNMPFKYHRLLVVINDCDWDAYSIFRRYGISVAALNLEFPYVGLYTFTESV